MRDTISHLKVKLAEAEEDTSCAALNRLRAKLRELMKDGQRADQQVSTVERSMQTPLDLYDERRISYEDLLTENGRLQAELTQIRRAVREEVAPIEKDGVVRLFTDEEAIDTAALLSRLQNCEVLLAELRRQLDVKTAHAEALQGELEDRKAAALAVRHEVIADEVAEVAKREPEELDEKVSLFYFFLVVEVRFEFR